MNKILVILTVIILTACTGEKTYPKRVCETYVTNNAQRVELYKYCLDKLAVMRSGQSYTTDDDEDLDEAINQCSSSAYYSSTRTICKYVFNEQEKQEFLRKTIN